MDKSSFTLTTARAKRKEERRRGQTVLRQTLELRAEMSVDITTCGGWTEKSDARDRKRKQRGLEARWPCKCKKPRRKRAVEVAVRRGPRASRSQLPELRQRQRELEREEAQTETAVVRRDGDTLPATA